MLVRRLLAALPMVCAALAVAQGCGARSPLIACREDSDCQNAKDLCTQYRCTETGCQVASHTLCDDGDPCTDDSCDKKTGGCVFAHQSVDLDGDKHYAPKTGFDPGAPGSCGDDCDDTDPNAYPGNKEVCDGIDNDCNGIIDDNATYTATAFGGEAQISELGLDYAEPEHLTRGGSVLVAGYSASQGGQFESEQRLLDTNAKPTSAPARVTGADAAASNAHGAWTGDRFGIAWSDRRTGNWDIFFAMFDAQGNKMAPGDERITATSGFSLYPRVTWTGHEFVVVWQKELGSAAFTLEGQRIGLDGTLLGNIVSLTSGSAEQGPWVAAGRKELGLTWVEGAPGNEQIMFETLGFDLSPRAAVPVTTGGLQGVDPEIAFNQGNYVISFSDSRPTKRAVYGATVSPMGAVAVPPTPIAPAGSDTRDAAILALGDRVVFVYSDDRDGNQGYEIYARTMAADLSPLSGTQRVTNAPGDSIGSAIAFTKTGSVGILFRDDRGAVPAVLSTTLVCHMPL